MTKILENMTDRLFRKVGSVAWDLQSGQLGIATSDKTSASIVTLTQKNGKYGVRQAPKSFSIKVPGFAVRTPIANLAVGDVVVMDDDQYAFYIGEGKHADDATCPVIRLLSATGHKAMDYVVPDEPLFGTNGILCVKNFAGAGDGAASMLPLMLLLKGDEDDGEDDTSNIGKMLALTALGGFGGGADGAANPIASMLPLLLADDGDCDLSMLFLLQAQQGQAGGQAGGFNMNMLLPLLLARRNG